MVGLKYSLVRSWEFSLRFHCDNINWTQNPSFAFSKPKTQAWAKSLIQKTLVLAGIKSTFTRWKSSALTTEPATAAS